MKKLKDEYTVYYYYNVKNVVNMSLHIEMIKSIGWSL